MLCQTVLTAIAISCTFSREITALAHGQGSSRVQIKDVVCILLLSGLQKEDLDANTLEKLRRHNVNIYDMNNETLRQECLMKSNLDSGKDKVYEIEVDPNDKFKISPKKSSELLTQLTHNDDMRIEKQKTEMVTTPETILADKSNVLRFIDEFKVQKEPYSDDKVKSKTIPNRLDDINITTNKEDKTQQIEYFKNIPSLDSVMKFWVKMTNRASSTVSTEATPIYSPYPTEQKIRSTATTVKLGNVRSNELINKMIAEYLSSQTTTTPTTTQVRLKYKNMDLVSRTIKELLNKSTKTENLPIPTNVKNVLNVKETNDIVDFSKLFQTYKNEDDGTEKAVRTPQKVISGDNIDIIRRSDFIPHSSVSDYTPQVTDIKTEKKMQALEYISNMLKVNNKFKLNNAVSFIELGMQDSLKNVDDQAILETKKMFGQHDMKNDVVFTTNAPNTSLVKDKTDSTDFIKEIAEKVKAIVMKDIKKEIPTTEKAILPFTATITTTSLSTTGHATIKETNESKVIQTLMEFFKEFKTMKEATKGTSDMPMKHKSNDGKLLYHNALPGRMFAPVIGGFNPVLIKTPVLGFKPLDINPYGPNLMPIPLGTILQPPLHEPKLIPQIKYNQKLEYRMQPITIQTNSAEIAPLVIKVSKPMKPMNQHIIVTTQNPFILQRDKKLHDDNKQRLHLKYQELHHVASKRDHIVENPTYDDLTKRLRIAENVKREYRESYKDKIQRIKERLEHNRDNVRELHHPLHSNRDVSSGGPVNSNHHSSPIVNSYHHDSLNTQMGSNRYEAFDRSLNPNHRETLYKPAEINYHQNHPSDLSYRDISSREFLSRLMDSNHRDRISELVQSNPYMHRPIDLDRESGNHQSDGESGNHQSDAYESYQRERSHPVYKVPKFHEKLEQVENQPLARDQMPLNKVKERTRYDDTHFNSFIKSQQKVTDMLERILAAKSETKQQNGEER